MDPVQIIEYELPPLPKDSDGRLKGYFGNYTNAALNCERLFCFICGAPAGWISTGVGKFARPVHVAATCNRCDEDIINKLGQGGAFPLEQIPPQYMEAFGIDPRTA